MPRTDIIVPQWNKSKYTVTLLNSIHAADTEDYRVILIDNGSKHAERERAISALEGHPHLIIRNPENLGFVQAVNQGLKASDAEYVCIQNNDTLVESDWLIKMLEVFDREADVAMVGPTTIWAASWQNRERLEKKWGLQEDWPTYKEVGSMLAFFCTVIARSVIDEIGLLDEAYGLGFGDDDDYAERVKRAGYRMFLRTDVTIPHYHRTTFKAQVPNWRKLQSKNMAIFRKRRREILQGR